jgi:rhamnogalacturonyl hydrolase YesR
MPILADFVYMVPPFLAYYGFATNNQTLLQFAYDQCRLYRQGLQDTNTKLWRHIAGGEGNGISDNGLWATGNAWATAGMLRVAATIQRSQFKDQMKDQVDDLGDWVEEIIVAAKSRTTSSGLVRNYIDVSSSFPETAGSTLLAYSALRLATMGFTNDHVGFANQIHSTVIGSHIASNGTLTEAVDPLVWDRQGTNGSPEGLSFVLLLQAAYNEYRAAGGEDNTSDKEERGSAIGLSVGRSWKGLALAGSLAIAGTLFV